MCTKVRVVNEVLGVYMSKRELVEVVIRVGIVSSTFWGHKYHHPSKRKIKSILIFIN